MKGVHTTCAYCGVGCGVIATPDDEGRVQITGDKNHPANFGRLCTKGINLGQTMSLDGRLLSPVVAGMKATWDEATALVAQKFKKAIAEHGPDSVAFYLSGQLLTEDYYLANKLMKGFMGSANIDTNSRLCMASSVVGHKRAFGTDTVPGTYEDLEQADLIVLVGSNLAWCHPVLHQRIMAAKEIRGTQVVNIDPRRTATSEMADLHLGIKPGGDVPLFLGLLSAIAASSAVDQNYVQSHVNGFEDALNAANTYETSEISHLTGLSESDLNYFYSKWIGTKRVVTIYSQGVNQATDGSNKVNAIINCHLATGRIGDVGCGPFSVTGQPNAMGGREVGGLSNMLAAHLDIENDQHRKMVADYWDTQSLPKHAGLKAVDLFNACAGGKIKALWIMCTNPAVSMPRANDVVNAIKSVDFVAVSDIMEKTDTTVLADVLMPATGWGEKDGTVTNSERRISRQRAFMKPAGQAKHDWQIICDVASKMGWNKEFDFKSPNEVFDEWAKMTYLSVLAEKDLDLTGLSNLSKYDYDSLEPVQWPVKKDKSETRFFKNGGFFTQDKKANMLSLDHKVSLNKTCEDFPFVLNTGRVRDHWHTMTRSAKSPALSEHMAEPYLEIHPSDAVRQGIGPATLVKVESPHGRVILRALISERVQEGQVFAPIHWTSEWASMGRVDTLIPSECDPFSGQPELKRASVKLTPFAAQWYAFAVSTAEPSPTTDYWAKAQTDLGWRMELAAKVTPVDFKQFARAELGLTDEEAIVYDDLKTGQHRIAFMKAGRLIAALFAAPNPVSVSRSFVASSLSEINTANILAGHGGTTQSDPGPLVCSCFNVGVNSLVELIETGKAVSLSDIGDALQAGTNCGSCRPELSALLKQYRPKVAAE